MSSKHCLKKVLLPGGKRSRGFEAGISLKSQLTSQLHLTLRTKAPSLSLRFGLGPLRTLCQWLWLAGSFHMAPRASSVPPSHPRPLCLLPVCSTVPSTWRGEEEKGFLAISFFLSSSSTLSACCVWHNTALVPAGVFKQHGKHKHTSSTGIFPAENLKSWWGCSSLLPDSLGRGKQTTTALASCLLHRGPCWL